MAGAENIQECRGICEAWQNGIDARSVEAAVYVSMVCRTKSSANKRYGEAAVYM
jgi:hypothetical protein